MDDEAEDKPKRISKGVLQLNFMRKTHNQIIAKEKKKKQQIDQTNQIYPTVLKPDDDPIIGLDGIVREERFTRLEELRFGRFSFNGQNPEVEKLMSGGDQSRKRKLAEEEAEEGEILDDTISVQELLPKYPQKNGGGFKMKQRSKKPKMRMSK